MRSSPSGADLFDARPQGYAHRGLHGPSAPENSLAAFEAAIQMGAGIECDVRLSGSGSALVFHDSDLKRMCGVALEIERTPTALLTSQRLKGSSQYIPALADLLDLVRGRVPLLIELKTRDGNAAFLCAEVLLELVTGNGSVGVMSFDPRVGRWFARHAPAVRRGVVIGKDENLVRRWFKLRWSRAQFAAVETGLVPTRWAQRLRARMPLATWTIRSAEQREMLENQVDALIWEGHGRPRI